MQRLLDPPIVFGHRGARAHAPDNTIESFRLALRLGATGLESDVWVTADGMAVLDHDGLVRVGLRRRPIVDVARAQLPAHMPTLGELFETCGTNFHLSLDVRDEAAAPAAVAAAQAVGFSLSRLWLCHGDWERLAGWRSLGDDLRLVNSTRLRAMRQGPERRAAQLEAARVDCVSLHYSDWSAGLTTLFHRFSRYTFAWDAQHARIIVSLLKMGIDGIYGDHVDRLVDALEGR